MKRPSLILVFAICACCFAAFIAFGGRITRHSETPAKTGQIAEKNQAADSWLPLPGSTRQKFVPGRYVLPDVRNLPRFRFQSSAQPELGQITRWYPTVIRLPR